MRYKNLTPFVVVAFISLLGLYDLFAYLANGETVSLYMWEQSSRVPLLPALLGTVMGHFYLDKNKFTKYIRVLFEIVIFFIIGQTISAMVFSNNALGIILWNYSKNHTWFSFAFGLLFGHLYWNKSIYTDENGNWRKPESFHQ